MTVPRPSSPATRGGATRNELKRAARRLFAERGIAAVGMREVVEAAGQRNAAAVHYYFGSKDDLLRELLIDGADLIEARRKALIDDAERKGAGMTLRDLVEEPGNDRVGGGSESIDQFIQQLLGFRMTGRMRRLIGGSGSHQWRSS